MLDKRKLGNLTQIKDGKKMASHPAYNVAAQLLAYYLNYGAGVTGCTAANTAAGYAQQVLAAAP